LNGDGYGDGILQQTITGYEFFDGTSMATPHVAGLAALLISAGANPADVPDLIRNTAEDIGSKGWDTWAGYGLIDPVAALSAVRAPGGDEPGPVADTTAPAITDISGTRSGSSLTLTWTTDEPATSEIEFEDYGVYGDADEFVTAHSEGFTIDAAASYTFRMISTDEAGNESKSAWWITNP
jgi:serine protease